MHTVLFIITARGVIDSGLGATGLTGLTGLTALNTLLRKT